MAAPTEDVSAMDEKDKTEYCTVEATVATGFESVAKAEAEEKLQTIVNESQKGRISIQCPIDKVEKVIELGCVDHIRVLLTHVPDFGFTDDQHENMLRLRRLVGDVNWPLGLKVWKKFFSFEHPIADTPAAPVTDFGEVTIPPPRQTQPRTSKKWRKKKRKDRKKAVAENSEEGTKENESKDIEGTDSIPKDIVTDNIALSTDTNDNNSNTTGNATVGEENAPDPSVDDISGSEPKKPRIRENPWDPMKPSFRVTCNRHGDNHNFDSMMAAANMGGAVYRYHGWNVKMTEFDIEVILNIEDQEVGVCIGLTKASLHHRNIAVFGPTTLRATIAYNMLRLCEIKSGDVVCDPMCGTGSISIQCAVSWPGTFNVCGDIAKKCMMRTNSNISFMEGAPTESETETAKKSLPIDPVLWDTCNSPLRDQSVDVFITDLPFGVRSGTKMDNWKLYPGTLMEMARVVRPLTGRACLLTEDKKCMIKILQSPVISRYWLRTRTLGINMGGLAAGVYVLARTRNAFTREATPTTLLEGEDKAVEQKDT